MVMEFIVTRIVIYIKVNGRMISNKVMELSNLPTVRYIKVNSHKDSHMEKVYIHITRNNMMILSNILALGDHPNPMDMDELPIIMVIFIRETS